jgi:hypothetical protein
LVVATNADAEVTERAVPSESLSPSNVQHPPMVAPSPFQDNASTLASLRMVSYLEGFQLMYPSPFLHAHFSSLTFKTPLSLPLPLGRLTRILRKQKPFRTKWGCLHKSNSTILQIMSNYKPVESKSFLMIMSNIALHS